jgi:hypothetical protein
MTADIEADESRHCEEQSDEAIQIKNAGLLRLRLAMTGVEITG